MSDIKQPKIAPGTCIPWEEKLKELPDIQGDPDLFKKVWNDNEALAYMYIWQVLLSF
jgi:hypothetical protein